MFMELGGLLLMFFKDRVIRSFLFLLVLSLKDKSVMFVLCVETEDNLSAMFLTSTKKMLNSTSLEVCKMKS